MKNINQSNLVNEAKFKKIIEGLFVNRIRKLKIEDKSIAL